MSAITHYRYERGYNFFDYENDCYIDLVEFVTVKETKCGFWIRRSDFIFARKDVFVLKDSRKRYAYTTKEEAFNNFKARTEKSLQISLNYAKSARRFLELSKTFRSF